MLTGSFEHIDEIVSRSQADETPPDLSADEIAVCEVIAPMVEYHNCCPCCGRWTQGGWCNSCWELRQAELRQR